MEDETKISTNIDTAIPLGMIVNELVTNSFKYAFKDVASPIITLRLVSITTNTYQLIITDNGSGLPNHQLPTNHHTLGLKLVHLFTEEIGGNISYKTKDGACFTIQFQISTLVL